MSRKESILPDEAIFSQFRKHCSSTDNWSNKYDKNGMKVWVEVPSTTQTQGQKNGSKIHMIKVGSVIESNCISVCIIITSIWTCPVAKLPFKM